MTYQLVGVGLFAFFLGLVLLIYHWASILFNRLIFGHEYEGVPEMIPSFIRFQIFLLSCAGAFFSEYAVIWVITLIFLS